MTARKKNPKTVWKRNPNTGPGRRVGNKYQFSTHLKKVGDYIETHPLTREDADKIIYAAHIWAYRKHCRVNTCKYYYPDGIAVRITVTSHTRKERNR